MGATALLAGVLLFTALLYLPALQYGFVYDDQGQIVDNALVHSWRFVPDYFRGHVWEYLYPRAPGNYYRPLNVLWFRINHALFGLQPMGWHGTTIALHLLATALVFAIARRITAQPFVAAVAALLFGIHPTRHEVVAWVSGSTESLCAVLFLASFLAYLRSRERRAVLWMAVSCVFYFAALLAKETAIVLPGLVLTHSIFYGSDGRTDPARQTSSRRFLLAAARASVYVPFVILYLVLRLHALHGFSHPQADVPVSTLLLTIPSVLFFYGQQWLLPVRISAFYDVALRARWDWVHVLLPLLALAAAGALLWHFRRRLGPRELGFSAAAALLPLLPVLYVSVFSVGELVHDRYAYLPGFGGALLLALLFPPLCRGRLVFRIPQRLLLVLLALALPLCYATANASSYWVDELTLFERAQQMAPENVLARNNYAVALARNGQQGTAITILQTLVDQHPDYFLANYNLGRLLYETNLLGAAEHYLEKARSLNPSDSDAHMQLGLVCLKTARRDEALLHFRRAAALRPHDAAAHFALGVTLASRGDCLQARAKFSEALRWKPDLATAREQMEKCETAAEGSPGVPVAPGPLRQAQLPAKAP